MALDQRIEQLLDEEHVAARARNDLIDEVIDVVTGNEALGDQLLARGLGKLVEHDQLGAELLGKLQDARLGPARHQAEDRARRIDLEQRSEQLLAVLIGPVDILADEDDRLVALELLLDAVEHADQGLPAGVGVHLGGRRRAARSQQHPEDLQRHARLARALIAGARRRARERQGVGIDQWNGAQQAPLDLVRLGILGEAEHVAREVRDHAVRRHCGANAAGGPDDHRLLARQPFEELPHEGALADPRIADDHDLPLALGDEHVAPRIAQRLELEIATVQSAAIASLAQPLCALLGAAQAVHPRTLDARIGVLVDLALARGRTARRVIRQIDRR